MKCYVAFGDNGVIIHANYNAALSYRKYIRAMNVRKFPDFQSAEEFALDHLSEVMPYYIRIPDHIVMDDLLTYSILKRNTENEIYD